ncbi:MAG: hypothetical protein ACEQSA_01145 [Weeksellaceae bacterium]
MRVIAKRELTIGDLYTVQNGLTVFRLEPGKVVRIICRHGEIPLSAYIFFGDAKAYLLSEEEVAAHIGHAGMILTLEQLENYIPVENNNKDGFVEAFIAFVVIGAYACMFLCI